ncbi:glycerol-3-phosphate acyltransferase [Candidatus Bipolaricaulota bacterium]
MRKTLLILRWLLVAVPAFAAGWLVVAFMVASPLAMSLWLALACLAGFATMLTIGLLFRRWNVPLAVVVAVVLFVAGYSGMTTRVLATPDPREMPEMTRVEGDPGLGHTAVVYFTHGEPSLYNPIGWINQFNEFDEQGIPFVPVLARPLFLYSLRNAYLKVGKSDHHDNHVRMLSTLEGAFRDAGDSSTRFYLSFLDDEPRPDAAVVQALNDGASRIVLSEVFLTVSNHTAEGEHLVDALQIEERFGVQLLKLVWPEQPYFLIAAGFATVGHVWPIFNRFQGGRGQSPIIGGLFVIDWPTPLIAYPLAQMLGLSLRSRAYVGRFSPPLIAAGWLFFRFRSVPHVLLCVGLFAIRVIAMRDEVRQYKALRAHGALSSFSEEVEMLHLGDRVDKTTRQIMHAFRRRRPPSR